MAAVEKEESVVEIPCSSRMEGMRAGEWVSMCVCVVVGLEIAGRFEASDSGSKLLFRGFFFQTVSIPAIFFNEYHPERGRETYEV